MTPYKKINSAYLSICNRSSWDFDVEISSNRLWKNWYQTRVNEIYQRRIQFKPSGESAQWTTQKMSGDRNLQHNWGSVSPYHGGNKRNKGKRFHSRPWPNCRSFTNWMVHQLQKFISERNFWTRNCLKIRFLFRIFKFRCCYKRDRFWPNTQKTWSKFH